MCGGCLPTAAPSADSTLGMGPGSNIPTAQSMVCDQTGLPWSIPAVRRDEGKFTVIRDAKGKILRTEESGYRVPADTGSSFAKAWKLAGNPLGTQVGPLFGTGSFGNWASGLVGSDMSLGMAIAPIAVANSLLTSDSPLSAPVKSAWTWAKENPWMAGAGMLGVLGASQVYDWLSASNVSAHDDGDEQKHEQEQGQGSCSGHDHSCCSGSGHTHAPHRSDPTTTVDGKSDQSTKATSVNTLQGPESEKTANPPGEGHYVHGQREGGGCSCQSALPWSVHERRLRIDA